MAAPPPAVEPPAPAAAPAPGASPAGGAAPPKTPADPNLKLKGQTTAVALEQYGEFMEMGGDIELASAEKVANLHDGAAKARTRYAKQMKAAGFDPDPSGVADLWTPISKKSSLRRAQRAREQYKNALEGVGKQRESINADRKAALQAFLDKQTGPTTVDFDSPNIKEWRPPGVEPETPVTPHKPDIEFPLAEPKRVPKTTSATPEAGLAHRHQRAPRPHPGFESEHVIPYKAEIAGSQRPTLPRPQDPIAQLAPTILLSERVSEIKTNQGPNSDRARIARAKKDVASGKGVNFNKLFAESVEQANWAIDQASAEQAGAGGPVSAGPAPVGPTSPSAPPSSGAPPQATPPLPPAPQPAAGAATGEASAQPAVDTTAPPLPDPVSAPLSPKPLPAPAPTAVDQPAPTPAPSSPASAASSPPSEAAVQTGTPPQPAPSPAPAGPAAAPPGVQPAAPAAPAPAAAPSPLAATTAEPAAAAPAPPQPAPLTSAAPSAQPPAAETAGAQPGTPAPAVGASTAPPEPTSSSAGAGPAASSLAPTPRVPGSLQSQGAIVERVNPNYQPPPGTPDDLASLRNQVIDTLGMRANSEQFAQTMATQEAHHAANEKPVAELQKGTTEAITATEAHKRAIASRDEANARKKAQESEVHGTLEDYSSRAGRLVTLTGPLRALARFTGLASHFPDEPEPVVRFKRGILKINADSSHFISQLDKMDETISAQKAQQAERDKGVAADAATIKATDQKAGQSGEKLDAAKGTADDFDEKNKQRKSDAGEARKSSTAAAARFDAQAQQKQGQTISLAAAMQSWAQGHRHARVAALEASRKRLEALGYRVTEVREK
jgi:hypothetical protein